MTQPPEYASPTERTPAFPSPWGKGFLAVAGTILLTGFGHLLAGRPKRAAAWFGGAILLMIISITWLFTPSLQPAVVVLVLVGAVFSLACVVDAFLCGRRSTAPMLYHPARRYLAGLALIAVVVFLQPATRLARFALTPWVEGYVIPTGSMSPTIKPGDRFLALKGPWAIKRWDLVVFRPPIMERGKELNVNWVKRVVGLPGEKIEIINGVVQVNGNPVTPPVPIGPYSPPANMDDYNGCEGNPIVLKEGEYFVLGDNSPVSGDSRFWRDVATGHQPGALPRDHIVGRATAIYWPLNRCGRLR